MKIARLLITKACQRSCSYCCNEQEGALDTMQDITVAGLQGYDQVLITGGEPMLYPQRIKALVKALRLQNPKVTIYLYSAYYRAAHTPQIMDMVDGIHFTLHEGTSTREISEFIQFQTCIQMFRLRGMHHKSYRLYIVPSVELLIPIRPALWSRIESFPFKEQCPLPQGEELFLLKDDSIV